MVLAIDIGNTNIIVGGVEKKQVLFVEKISTDVRRTGLEYAIQIRSVITLSGYKEEDFAGCIISSVVPGLTASLREAAEKLLDKKAIVVGPGVKNGLHIALDNPGEIGADQVAAAVAAIDEYAAPMVIVDMGTATTFSVIDDKKRFLGGMICPGVQVSLDALTSKASKLFDVDIDNPGELIGRNTVSCIKSGSLYGTAAMIDGVISRITDALGTKLTVIATGSFAGKTIPLCNTDIVVDDNLSLKGLEIIFDKNHKN